MSFRLDAIENKFTLLLRRSAALENEDALCRSTLGHQFRQIASAARAQIAPGVMHLGCQTAQQQDGVQARR